MLPVINLFGINIYPYGLMIGIGVVTAVLLFIKRSRKRGYNEEWAFNLAVLCCIAGIVGSKVFYIISFLPDIIKDPSIILRDFNSGFVIYGGIIFGVIMGWWYSKKKKWSFLNMFDLAAPALAMAQGFGRIGCLFAGCCYGRETDSFIGIQLNNSPYAPHNVSLIPTQAISSLGDFAIFGLLMWFDNRKKKSEGQTGAMYLLLYSIGRYIIEIFRDDPRGDVFNIFSTSQFICIFIFIIGAALFYRVTVKARSLKANTACEAGEETAVQEGARETDTNDGISEDTSVDEIDSEPDDKNIEDKK